MRAEVFSSSRARDAPLADWRADSVNSRELELPSRPVRRCGEMADFRVLATDYDGTIASQSVVDEETLCALSRLRDSRQKIILVTGRELDDLRCVFSQLDLFDLVVAENGALLFWPATSRELVLAEPPLPDFVKLLSARGVDPLSVGRVIVATREPYEMTVLEVIKAMGLELQVIFNKGAVMVLPSGVNKATGLKAALKELALKPEQTIGVGDAENDHAFLELCGCAVAVGNAIPAVKDRAHLVTRATHGAGVQELIERWMTGDLESARTDDQV
jgi:hydroxymethylpyrimidine pyrophosphatase-like HAD family hydrolase